MIVAATLTLLVLGGGKGQTIPGLQGNGKGLTDAQKSQALRAVAEAQNAGKNPKSGWPGARPGTPDNINSRRDLNLNQKAKIITPAPVNVLDRKVPTHFWNGSRGTSWWQGTETKAWWKVSTPGSLVEEDPVKKLELAKSGKKTSFSGRQTGLGSPLLEQEAEAGLKIRGKDRLLVARLVRIRFKSSLSRRRQENLHASQRKEMMLAEGMNLHDPAEVKLWQVKDPAKSNKYRSHLAGTSF
jgi:hypothetical protein